MGHGTSAINNKEDKDFFIDRLEAEIDEKIDGKPGFPGNRETIDQLKKSLGEKNLF